MNSNGVSKKLAAAGVGMLMIKEMADGDQGNTLYYCGAILILCLVHIGVQAFMDYCKGRTDEGPQRDDPKEGAAQ